jgi:hypothetical protein
VRSSNSNSPSSWRTPGEAAVLRRKRRKVRLLGRRVRPTHALASSTELNRFGHGMALEAVTGVPWPDAAVYPAFTISSAMATYPAGSSGRVVASPST